MVVIAVTGHRPDKLGGYGNDLVHRAIRRHMRAFLEQAPEGPLTLLSGGALGIDQFWIEVGHYLDIPVEIIIPFKGYDSKWPAQSRAEYKKLLDKATAVRYLFNEYRKEAYQIRNQYLVDNCDLLIAYWNGTPGGTGNCVDYAAKTNRQLEIFNTDEIINDKTSCAE